MRNQTSCPKNQVEPTMPRKRIHFGLVAIDLSFSIISQSNYPINGMPRIISASNCQNIRTGSSTFASSLFLRCFRTSQNQCLKFCCKVEVSLCSLIEIYLSRKIPISSYPLFLRAMNILFYQNPNLFFL